MFVSINTKYNSLIGHYKRMVCSYSESNLVIRCFAKEGGIYSQDEIIIDCNDVEAEYLIKHINDKMNDGCTGRIILKQGQIDILKLEARNK